MLPQKINIKRRYPLAKKIKKKGHINLVYKPYQDELCNLY